MMLDKCILYIQTKGSYYGYIDALRHIEGVNRLWLLLIGVWRLLIWYGVGVKFNKFMLRIS